MGTIGPLGAVVAATAAVIVAEDETFAHVIAEDDTVAHVIAGVVVDRMTVAAAEERGLFVVDLGDRWVPMFLRPDPSLGRAGEVPWHEHYIGLAHFPPSSLDATRPRPPHDALELWGIPPSLSTVLEQLEDEHRHRCHDDIDDGALAALHVPLAIGVLGRPRARATTIASLRAREAAGRASTADRARLAALVVVDAAAQAVLGHLVCAGFLTDRDAVGGFGPRAATALARFQRQEALPGEVEVIDAELRERLVSPARLRAWRTLLRVVRERVVDAAGLLADGTAADDEQTVAGEFLDARRLRVPLRATPLPGAAPDVVGSSTDAVVRALGLDDPETASTVLRALPRGRVAVAFPSPPRWHRSPMDLRVEIDRGDVDDRGLWQRTGRRPTFVVFAHDGEQERALVRWPTTVGGVQRERFDDTTTLAAKASPQGSFVWTQLWAQPAWYAPPSTPDDELLLRRRDRVSVAESVIGPGHRSAYGLVMLPHVRGRVDDARRIVDTGIRTHGTGAIATVLHGGPSHGCHRLLPVHAHRLATFLLHHRATRRDGPIVQDWQRSFAGVDVVARRRLRGVRWTFHAPIAVHVVDSKGNGERHRSVPTPGDGSSLPGPTPSAPSRPR
jgi:hypothetical protein